VNCTRIVPTLSLLLLTGGIAHAQLSLKVKDPTTMGVAADVRGGAPSSVPNSVNPTFASSINGSTQATASLDNIAGSLRTLNFNLNVSPNDAQSYASTEVTDQIGAISFEIDSAGGLKPGDPVTLQLDSLLSVSGSGYFAQITLDGAKYTPGQPYTITSLKVGDTFTYWGLLLSTNPASDLTASLNQSLQVRERALGDPSPVPEPGSLASVCAAAISGSALMLRKRSRQAWRLALRRCRAPCLRGNGRAAAGGSRRTGGRVRINFRADTMCRVLLQRTISRVAPTLKRTSGGRKWANIGRRVRT
jgi:hypothetical protein